MNEERFGQLLARQRELEENSLARGQVRFLERLQAATSKGKASTVGAARKLLTEALTPTSNAIQEMLDISSSRKGVKHIAVKWCRMIGPDVAAYMTTKVLLDGASTRLPLRRAALDIAELIGDELRYRRFEAEAPHLFKYQMGRFQTGNYSFMARSLNSSMRYAELDLSDLEMPQSQRVLLGTKLIDLFMQSTQLVEKVSHSIHAKRSGRGRKAVMRTESYIVLAEDTARWLNARNGALEFLWPVNLPMVTPPLPWGPTQRGGYRYGLRNKYPFIRGAKTIRTVQPTPTEMPAVYESVNRIQETAWRINPAVLSLVQQIKAQGGLIAGVPRTIKEELPARPHNIDTSEEVRRVWKKAAGKVRARNHAMKRKVAEFQRVLGVAETFKDAEAIWFPCNVDFRGRVYPMGNYLSPQGDDLSKGLLTFAQGKPLGENGAVWLALHGANCLGETPDGQKVSRMTLQERVDWIFHNSEAIEGISRDPLSDTWWADAEKVDGPLRFYAFCVEWAGFMAMHRQGKGAEYVCTLPCSMDGTCNGLQHFAALLRDEEGARAVNVLPQDRPQDIYQRISDVVLAKLEEIAVDDPLAAIWLRSGQVTRKLCKRPTMTFGYGSKRFGFKQQLIDYMMGLDGWKDALKPMFTRPDAEGVERNMLPVACDLMSGLIWDALREVVVAAFGGMAWMQKAARGVVRSGKCVEWTVPATGFRVKQQYMVNTKKQVKTILAGKVFQPAVYEATGVVDAVKQANAVSPNFVHSLDAAALMLTVQQASDEGIDCFAMVHDSYGTVPADCALLARATRESFARLYMEHDVIGSLYRTFLEHHENPEDCPPPPMLGTLDVSQVIGSDYFFA